MIAATIRFLTGAQGRWIGVDPVEADGTLPQRIYYANHQSNLDAPVIWASLPPRLRRRTRPVAAQDYWDGGPLRRFISCRVFRCVLIERKKVTKRSNPMVAMEAAIEKGDSLILFPEGTRSLDEEGSMNEFKPGIYHLARKFPHLQLVPTYLENLNRILPKGEFLPAPILAAVTFGPTLKLEADESKLAFLTRAKAALLALSTHMEAGHA
jgi:1-acyl-sn-glycerol-3-phosphate acyltransferase